MDPIDSHKYKILLYYFEQGHHSPKVVSSNLATATTNPQSPIFTKDCETLKFKEKCLIVFDSLK